MKPKSARANAAMLILPRHPSDVETFRASDVAPARRVGSASRWFVGLGAGWGGIALAFGLLAEAAVPAAAAAAPNVIMIVTDDQGYGDLGAHGNPWLRTPHLDRLRSESVRLEDFHVDPVCTPTRAALMTGRYAVRTGAWAVTEGRQLLRRDEVTMAQVFAAGGYRTGIFGKWHLGDNYPYGPQYRGFQESVVLRGGGVGEIPDAWGNNYFDDRYWRNGRLERFEGYCTDVFFLEALRFIRAADSRSFFVYLPTNAMHSPHLVADRYADPYRRQGVPEERAKFYGMIANFDENLGRLLAALEETGLARDTVLVFFGDNGTSVGGGRRAGDGFNAGMRGNKGTLYEGGHRVACFVRWPGKFEAGREVRELTTHRDLLPTLIELCGLPRPAGRKLDGASIVPLLRGQTQGWAERVAIVDRQANRLVQDAPFVVMRGRWRLVNRELFDLAQDPGQSRNLAGQHPDVVGRLRSDYEAWWRDVSAAGDAPAPFVVGAPEENPTVLTARDWHPTAGPVPWRQEALAEDGRFDNGCWYIEPARAGRYQIRLARFPDESGRAMRAVRARLAIEAQEWSAGLQPAEPAVSFMVTLSAGRTQRMQTWLQDVATDRERGAYYVTVRWMGEGPAAP